MNFTTSAGAPHSLMQEARDYVVCTLFLFLEEKRRAIHQSKYNLSSIL